MSGDPAPEPARPQPEQPDQRERPDQQPGPTGHPAVDAALQALADSAGQEPAAQLATYQAAHRTLRETLASIDEEG